MGLIALLSACSKPADPTRTKNAVEWLEDYYKKQKFPAVKGGTGFVAFKVIADGNKLEVDVWTPMPEHARMLRGMDIAQKVRYWEQLACPSRGDTAARLTPQTARPLPCRAPQLVSVRLYAKVITPIS